MKALNIIETAYRATLEEQDDTVVWITHAMKGADAELGVLLRGNAVNYVVRSQDASGLRFGDEKQTQPPDLCGDVAGLIGKGVPVYVVADDLTQRGIDPDETIDGFELLNGSDLAGLLDGYDQIWHW